MLIMNKSQESNKNKHVDLENLAFSETEEQRKERLRIRREKDGITKKLQNENKSSSETEDHEKQKWPLSKD